LGEGGSGYKRGEIATWLDVRPRRRLGRVIEFESAGYSPENQFQEERELKYSRGVFKGVVEGATEKNDSASGNGH